MVSYYENDEFPDTCERCDKDGLLKDGYCRDCREEYSCHACGAVQKDEEGLCWNEDKRLCHDCCACDDCEKARS